MARRMSNELRKKIVDSIREHVHHAYAIDIQVVRVMNKGVMLRLAWKNEKDEVIHTQDVPYVGEGESLEIYRPSDPIPYSFTDA